MTGTESQSSKTARVKEEVVIRKDATERTETVRRKDIEIVKEAGVEPATGTAPGESTKYNEPKI